MLMVGAGGHCRVILDCLDVKVFDSVGVIAQSKFEVGQNLNGAPIIGTDEDLPYLFEQGYQSAIIAVGSTSNPKRRMELYHTLKEIGFAFPAIIDKSVIVSSKEVFIGEGVFISKGVIINTGAAIESFSILNTGCIIEHDCKIASFVHIAPGSSLSGGVSVGMGSHIGTGTSIINNCNIGECTIIGAGSVVVNDIDSHVKAFGVPCRKMSNSGF